jgi:hypothetical protein
MLVAFMAEMTRKIVMNVEKSASESLESDIKSNFPPTVTTLMAHRGSVQFLARLLRKTNE